MTKVRCYAILKEKVVSNRMRNNKLVALLLCFVMVLVIFPITASADLGPKPSVRITFENLVDEECWATLLSSVESTGPASAWDGKEENAQHKGNQSYYRLEYDIWKAFVDYAKYDDFYFLQKAWRLDGDKELVWSYYPPDEFKILLYFPESGEYAISGICERYAFDSYFTVDYNEDMNVHHSDDDQVDDNEDVNVHHSYNYQVEITALIARILITIIIEMGIAFMFGYWEKKQLLLLAGMNAETQIILNLLLNIINCNSGSMAFVLFYILFEIIVIMIEAAVLLVFLNKISVKQRKHWQMVIYAIVANVVSFVSGLFLANWLPAMF